MRALISLFTIVLLGMATHAEDWQVLFNGNNLDGWHAVGSQSDFKVVNGTLRAQAATKALSHLMYVGDQKDGFVRFKNFELDLFARSEPGSNSGIFIHTDKKIRSNRRFMDTGYEIQLNSSQKEKKKTGSLYDVVNLDKSPVDETQWFRVNIKVDGKRITVKLNGKQVVDYTEPTHPQRPARRKGRVLNPNGGAIALQAHDPDSVFYFKDIRIRRLP